MPATNLTARITHTTTTLITRLENILAIALPATPPSSSSLAHENPTSTATTNGSGGPNTSPAQPSSSGGGSSLATTAIESFNLDVETTALIKAAEDLMGLGRGIKEIWLAKAEQGVVRGEGGMVADDEEGAGREVGAREEDVRVVVDGLAKLFG